MYQLLIRLMFVAALAQFGMSLKECRRLNTRPCVRTLELRSLDVLRIDWKPVSVFPEEYRSLKR